jgi:hypothetical protein
MKCQSDYDPETEEVLRQADECVEEWWDGEPQKAAKPGKKEGEEEDPTLIVKREVRKRGLTEGSEEAGL